MSWIISCASTGASRLVLTGGVALNAVGNMRLLEHFDEAWFSKAQQRNARLHLWVPPTPGDPGVTIGAAWLFAHLAGAPRGAPMTHAFYCGSPPSHEDIAAALEARDIASTRIGDISTADGRDAVADLMAFMVAQNGVIALYQGAAETGPRALGHRSILANPCDAKARELLNERVKYREAIRPLAPMATLEAAQAIFRAARRRLRRRLQRLQLHGADGAIETARARKNSGGDSCRRHRADPDRARGRRSPHLRLSEGARPPHRRRDIRQHLLQCRRSHRADARQAIDTLRRSRGLDVVLLVADDGAVTAAWHGGEPRQRPVYRLAFGMDRRADEVGARVRATACASTGLTVGDVAHFAPSGAPPPGQNTDTRVSFAFAA